MSYAINHNQNDNYKIINKVILTICASIFLLTKVTKADENFLIRRRKLQVDKGYKYNQGNCPNAGSTGLACPPSNLGAMCDKGNREEGSFMDCWNACKPAYCCITDTPSSTNFVAPSCSSDENCAGYAYCYIIFWKLGDTIGPQTYLRMNYQNDDAFLICNGARLAGGHPIGKLGRWPTSEPA